MIFRPPTSLTLTHAHFCMTSITSSNQLSSIAETGFRWSVGARDARTRAASSAAVRTEENMEPTLPRTKMTFDEITSDKSRPGAQALSVMTNNGCDHSKRAVRTIPGTWLVRKVRCTLMKCSMGEKRPRRATLRQNYLRDFRDLHPLPSLHNTITPQLTSSALLQGMATPHLTRTWTLQHHAGSPSPKLAPIQKNMRPQSALIPKN